MINQAQHHKKMKLVVTFLSLLVFLFILTPPTHAFSPTTPPVVEEPKKEEEKEEITLTPVGDPFTPEGNLTLVDDIYTNNEGDKQFITAVSKAGNYFYLVVDRAGDTNNVYLMNLVDEADIMALITGEPVGFEEDTEEETPEPEPKPEPVPDIEIDVPEEKSSVMPLIGLLALGGGAGFYFLKIKPSQGSQRNPMLDDFDDEDDEEEEENDD